MDGGAEGKPGGRRIPDPGVTEAAEGLDALEHRLRFDLTCLNHPPPNWVVPVSHPSGAPVAEMPAPAREPARAAAR